LIDLCLDICYCFITSKASADVATASLVFLLLQPAVYYVSYQLGLLAFCICDQDSAPYRGRVVLAIALQAPIYTLLAELKLLMSPLYLLSAPNTTDSAEDRIKHDSLGPVIAHAVLESLPMLVVQAYNNSVTADWGLFEVLSVISSSVCVCLGGLTIWMVSRMNQGGLWWITEQRADVKLTTKASILLDNLTSSGDN
jgi:hypothetical protein